MYRETHIKFGEFFQDMLELFFETVLSELDLAHIELSNTADIVVFVDNGGGLALRPRQDNVDKVAGRRHRLNLFEIVQRHLWIVR